MLIALMLSRTLIKSKVHYIIIISLYILRRLTWHLQLVRLQYKINLQEEKRSSEKNMEYNGFWKINNLASINSLLLHFLGKINIELKILSFFFIWSAIFSLVFIYNLLFVPFSIGLRYDIPNQYIAIDIIVLILTLIDSILRPFLAINK